MSGHSVIPAQSACLLLAAPIEVILLTHAHNSQSNFGSVHLGGFHNRTHRILPGVPIG
jgi:hypothetical protein